MSTTLLPAGVHGRMASTPRSTVPHDREAAGPDEPSAVRREEPWEAVVARLVADRGDALLRYAQLLCGSPDDAADLVQDALVKTFGRLRAGLTVQSAEAYVRRSILTTHVDRARRRQRWRRIAHLAYRPDEVPAATDALQERMDLTEQLQRLSPRERACVVLRYYEDLKVDDIAEWLGISPGTVKRYLSDALAKLAIALDPAHDAGSGGGHHGR
ncbi:sigma-70 family RNA polymerase sigma factor [Diaminobutyricimonas aerilata]|uniref:sigma-70 family RNA polymerase sigma factor n=1 Tax=Diaminobutyricimonas aerilata TaxID=1162967 RepID=UPI001FE3005A|nr:sigma-70 family RNA polymerase sigma factor [Diaminobutyricimonas aerilata]